MTWFVVDGMDGCGKSTCADIIEDKLKRENHEVFKVTHPDQGCLVGRLENAYLHKEGRLCKILSTVFYILDVLDSLAKMRVHRKEYNDFIFVRYIMAVAYLPKGLQEKAYTLISKVLPMPDELILVDVDAETSMSRILGRGEALEAFENLEDLKQVRESMLSLSDGWTVIDNSRPLDEVRRQIEDHVDGILRRYRA
ncbi:MAG: deoxynucleoside kinase [Candidatus Methanomethylophilaceae archaeon]|nr:deoxynucleoside kinase [Candidatus Methanomethylophilaceae archaeon]